MSNAPRGASWSTAVRGRAAGESGAVMIESAVAILIFLMSLFFLIELCRYSYYSLATQYFVAQATRFAALTGVEDEDPNPVQCCIDRVNRVKTALAQDLQSVYAGVNPATEIFVCDILTADCNICDDPSLPLGGVGPGFVRNRFMEIRVDRAIPLMIPIGFNIWRLNRRALAKAESTIRDCRI